MKSAVLKDFFEAVEDVYFNHPTVELHVEFQNFGNNPYFSWWIGRVSNPTAGSYHDEMHINNLDDDKLIDWTNELKRYIYGFVCTNCGHCGDEPETGRERNGNLYEYCPECGVWVRDLVNAA